jgi:hypothetical protein
MVSFSESRFDAADYGRVGAHGKGVRAVCAAGGRLDNNPGRLVPGIHETNETKNASR